MGSLRREDRSLLYKYKDSGKTQASGPKTPLRSQDLIARLWICYTPVYTRPWGPSLLQAGPCCYSSAEALFITPLVVFLTLPWYRGPRGHLAFCNLPSKQKLQLVLAPLHSLASRYTEHGLQDPGSLLAHSFWQLDRIDSLSEQVSFLEEQLGSCEFHCTPLHPQRS